jgi:ornithine cyclodeaminase/alanine dehydrogenase-like protein (mu-crystallin family)
MSEAVAQLLADVEAGRLSWRKLHRLAELFGPPAEHCQPLGEHRRCLINPVGWGAADLAVASLIWQRAQQRSVGQWIDL